MKAIKISLLMTLAILLLVSPCQVRADAAPPMNPPGGNVSPEGGTQVQMVAEQVTIDFRQSTDDSANVTAWFLFHNTGNADEHFKVRFPLNGDSINFSGKDYPLIKDFTALIDGQQLITQVVLEDDPNAPLFYLGGNTVMYWSEFDVDFPVGKDVKLTVRYTLKPTEENSYAYIYYILATGAGWKGPIGKADVFIRFPYILNNYNLPDYNAYSNSYLTSDSQTIRSIKIIENELWLHWEGLEPKNQDNIRVTVVQPHLWQAVLQERIRAIGTPDDASAWLALARSYASADSESHWMFGNEQICQAFIKAFERALTIDPNDASLHAEFANDMVWAYGIRPNDYYKAIIMNELAITLTLDPNNADAKSALEQMNQWIPNSILPTPGPFPIFVTATPTLEATAELAEPTSSLPSPTPQRTATLIPAYISPQPTILPANEPNRTNSNLPGLLILLAVVFAGGIGAGILINRRK
jgi:hypothetical protein